MNFDIRVKKLDERAKLPVYGSEYAAGADLYAIVDGGEITVGAGETAFIHTGIAVELPLGTVGLIYARSGMACKKGLAPANKVGVVDCDYRGEIMVALHNHSSEPKTVAHGDRIAQFMIAPYYTATFTESEELSDTVRGEGGFGSTGGR
ncbi:MAG: dUTP diphosphatase [Clostridia bacterium]|nr:dUTP diphosphatase [Clostridia bacterium]